MDHVIIKEGHYEEVKAAEDKQAKVGQKNGPKGKSDNSEIKTWYFPCQRWLDVGQDDKKVKRELKPSSRPNVGNPAPPASKSKYCTNLILNYISIFFSTDSFLFEKLCLIHDKLSLRSL